MPRPKSTEPTSSRSIRLPDRIWKLLEEQAPRFGHNVNAYVAEAVSSSLETDVTLTDDDIARLHTPSGRPSSPPPTPPPAKEKPAPPPIAGVVRASSLPAGVAIGPRRPEPGALLKVQRPAGAGRAPGSR